MITIKTIPDKSKAVSVSELKIGDVGIITDQRWTQYVGHLVVMTYSGLVSLSDPSVTWGQKNFITIKESFKIKLVDIDIIVKERS